MAHQHLRPIDKEFEDADDTGVLVLSGRNLRSFPTVASDLVDYNEIIEADFSKNRFDRLPREVISFKSLVKITCHHNNIRFIPEELSTLVELRTVDFSPLTDHSREDYREAALTLYMQQERQKNKVRTQRSSSPPVISTTPKEDGSSNYNTLPKRKSVEKMDDMLKGGGRSLPGEKQPRSGSWNASSRNAKPVLPNKYSATPPAERAKSAHVSDETKAARNSPAHRPHSELTPSETASPKRSQKPAPLDLSPATSHPPAPSGESDREGSITPTNEDPPTLDSGPTTPTKDKPEAEELKSQVSVPGLMIQELESSPVLTKRQTPSQSPSELTATLPDSDWTKNTSPRRKKEKDVFKFLKESDPNYTIRRQQLQMNLILEKNQTVKKAVEQLLGVELADDLGEWVSDGVILCELVNKLHPGTISTINTPPSGEKISRIKRTLNISSFIDACRKLKVPDEELCSAGDIIEMKDPVRVITCLQRVLETKPGNLV